ncbi:hypothetical protein GGR52DRAFT_121295 [Hypoxylon sp. FL1284]|nr:hypothetical protein GGR52DRAFT_121295 [Hypoxylon sp. FL1284]
MAAPRQSAFMPTIKCSNCGNQVEISMMGEHICGSAPAAEEAPPMPDLLGGAFSSLKANVFDKFARNAPPTVDTSAANKSYARPDQLTPVSASTGSLAISPKTPYGRPGAGSSGDDYFAPAIASSPRRPGGHGGFGESESYDGDSAYGTSPNKSTNFLTRMNSIAPGPFETNRRPSAGLAARNNSRDATAESQDDSLQVGYTLERPGTAGSTSSKNSANRTLPRAPRKNGYGGFGAPRRDSEDFAPQPVGLGKRSETFPDKLTTSTNDVYDVPARAPSAPGTRPDRLRTPSNGGGNWPGTASERSQRPSFGAQDALRPPLPSGRRPSDFSTENMYHSPSVSQSSSNSGYSHMSRPSQASSNTSPARSVGSNIGGRRPSDTSGFDALMDDLQFSMEQMQPKAQTPSPEDRSPKQVEPPKPSTRRAPPEALRPEPLKSIGGTDSRLASPIKSPSAPEPSPSRIDPAVQGGLSNIRSPPPPPTPTTREGPSQHTRQPSRSRGSCRACRQPITGKSISSADGRLTGRYHKGCFACTTCKEPFPSATFYVLGDRPYCELHYHKLNGSLCGSCGRGIEGQYLEDEAAPRRKHHPGCFRCPDCGVVLRDGYFDVEGRAYCERDAWRRVQSAVQAQRQMPMPPPPPQQQQQQQQFQGPPGSQAYPPRRPSAQGQGPAPPRGLPAGPKGPNGPGPLNRPFGLPTGNRLAPGQALGRGGLRPMPRMEKRMTRLGMM